MTDYQDSAFVFDCEGDSLVGVISRPASGQSARVGVLIVVGGPQYRVGSHRQFVLLGRFLAQSGFSCMRFDYRGMGDSGGVSRSFETIHADMASAVNAFFEREPAIERVVLWGLCDGATACALYAPQDCRVAGLVLLNPWIRNELSEARTYLKHYYGRRLLSRGFWQKLVSGKVDFRKSSGSLGTKLRQVFRSDSGKDIDMSESGTLYSRIVATLDKRRFPTLLLLSGRDYVAREFEDAMGRNPACFDLNEDPAVTIRRCVGADHTFSSATMREWVADGTLRFVHDQCKGRVG